MKYEKTAIRLREALSEANLTQQELADKSHIGKSSISHYINGTNEPGNKSAYQIAEVLKVNPAWLMGLDAPKHLYKLDIEEMQIELTKKISELSEEQQKHLMSYVDFLLKAETGGNYVDNE